MSKNRLARLGISFEDNDDDLIEEGEVELVPDSELAPVSEDEHQEILDAADDFNEDSVAYENLVETFEKDFLPGGGFTKREAVLAQHLINQSSTLIGAKPYQINLEALDDVGGRLQVTTEAIADIKAKLAEWWAKIKQVISKFIQSIREFYNKYLTVASHRSRRIKKLIAKAKAHKGTEFKNPSISVSKAELRFLSTGDGKVSAAVLKSEISELTNIITGLKDSHALGEDLLADVAILKESAAKGGAEVLTAKVTVADAVKAIKASSHLNYKETDGGHGEVILKSLPLIGNSLVEARVVGTIEGNFIKSINIKLVENEKSKLEGKENFKSLTPAEIEAIGGEVDTLLNAVLARKNSTAASKAADSYMKACDELVKALKKEGKTTKIAKEIIFGSSAIVSSLYQPNTSLISLAVKVSGAFINLAAKSLGNSEKPKD